jgi:acetyl esterase
MPLDPFFAERLRLHRRYLAGQAWKSLRARLDALWPFARKPPATAAVPAPRRAQTGSPRARARAKHRRAALAWDRTELQTVGVAGPDLRVTEHTVPVAGRPDVRVRIYYPPGGDGPVPGVLALFGGAFRIGGIDYPTTDAANRRRAADAGVAVAAVAYSLAPEHRYPTQVEQAYAALVWLAEHAGELGIDPDRLGIAGTSAGGCLAAATALLNRDGAHIPLRLQLLEVPVVDLTGRHLDLRATWRLGIPSPLVLRELLSVARTYLGSRADAREPAASPLRAASHADLPPTVILTAQYDPLRAQGAAYAAALRAAGVDASAVQYLGVTHDTPLYAGALPAARRWHDDVVSALRRLHAPTSA